MAIFLKFGVPVAGDASAASYSDEISIYSVSWGLGRSAYLEGNNVKTTDPGFSEVSIQKGANIASPELFIQAAAGKSLLTATITWTSGQGTGNPSEIQQQIVFSNPIITAYSQSSSGEMPGENFSFHFDKIHYKIVNWDGTKKLAESEKTYDLRLQKAV